MSLSFVTLRFVLSLFLTFAPFLVLEAFAQQSQKVNKIRLSPQQTSQIQALVQQGLQQQSTNPQAAIQTFSQAIEMVPQEAAFYCYRGRVFFSLNNLAAAKADFTAAIGYAPKMAFAYFYRGACHLNQQLLPQAESDFLASVRLEPTNYDYLRNLGIVQNLLQKYPDALTTLSQAIRVKPKEASGYYERGNIYRLQNKYREAIQDYAKSVQLDPTNLNAYINSATAKGMLNDYKGAIEDYTYLIKNTPPNKLNYYNRGYLYSTLNQYDNAIADFTEAIKLDSTMLRARVKRLLALQSQGLVKEVLAEAQLMLKNNPQDAKAFTNAGGAVQAKLLSDDFLNGDIFAARAKTRGAVGDESGACSDLNKAGILENENAKKQYLNLCTPQGIFIPTPSFPTNLQFYPRNSSDSAFVLLSGTLTQGGFDSVYTLLYKNNTLIQRIVRPIQYNYLLRGTESVPQAVISAGVRIHAELAEYSVRFGIKSATRDTVLAVRDSLVCGDVLLVSGQSNSVLGQMPRTLHNEYLRTFYMGYHDSFWGLAAANNNTDDYNVGGFALQLQERIAAEQNVPVCIINGGLSGSTIEQHFRNDAVPTDQKSWYTRLYWRAEASVLWKSAKAMIWFQGESNQGAGYTEKFMRLYNAWKQDYQGLKKIYVVQIRPSDCGQIDHASLREQQRGFVQKFSDVEVLASSGLPTHDGCHFGNEGYIMLGNQLYNLLARDFYHSTDTLGIASPNLRRAYWTTPEKKEIALNFATNDSLTVGKDTSIGGKIRTLAQDGFLLDGQPLRATSLRIENKNTVILTLNSASSSAQTIGYIPDRCYAASLETPCSLYEGPWLLTRRGVGALTFHNVPIETAP